jgi:hypothetical protein
LLREYQQSSAWVRQKYDGKEDQCQRLGYVSHCAAGDPGQNRAIWLKESDGETSGKVAAGSSNQQAVEFPKSAAASI